MKKTIENISIEQYFSMQDSTEYDIFIKALKPKNLFCGKEADYSRLTYDEVEVIRSILRRPTLKDIRDLFIMLYNIRPKLYRSAEKAFNRESVFNLFAAQNYLEQWITTLMKREESNLSGRPDVKMEMINAGKRLGPVSHLLTKIRLAEKFATTPEIIGSWKYSKVFSILVAEKIQNDVLRDYNEIK